MSIWEKISAAFSSSGEEPVMPESAEPAKVTFIEAAGVNVDADDANWRAITDDSKRDLAPVTQDRMQKVAVKLWESNLIARALIELPVAYLLAEGVTFRVKDEDAETWLYRFWRDPITKMSRRLEQIVRELSLFGEQCLPAFVNEVDGHVRLGVLDPSLIGQVITDPDNAAQPIGIVTKRDARGRYRKYRIIINGPESVFSIRTQQIRATFTDGECFYFAVNQLSAGRRGRSDMLAAANWADGYEQSLMRLQSRADLLYSFIWTVTLKGADEAKVLERAKKITAPKPNSVRVTNDSETWTTETPDIKASDQADHFRLFRNHILGGAFIPEHWYGGGGDVNRNAASEMGEPTFKMFTMRQTAVKDMVLEILIFQLRMKMRIEYGMSDIDIERELEADDWQVAVEFPEMTARDTTKYAAALTQVVVACASAIEQGLMTEETAVSIIAAIAGRLGVRVDVAEELRKAREKLKNGGADEGGQDDFPDPPDIDDPDEERPGVPAAAVAAAAAGAAAASR